MINDKDIKKYDDEAAQKIKHLEHKIEQLESRIPKQFPDVKFLNYRERKRILVSTNNSSHL